MPEHGAIIGSFSNAQHHRDGLFSEVFVAKDPKNNNRLVALKITTPSMMTPPHDSVREARILASLNKAPCIIVLLETFTLSPGRFVLVFPFQPYELSTVLDRDALPRASQKTILHDLFTALDYIHSRDIIHRDVKPGNILLASPAGPAYLADFGIAWSAHDLESEPSQEKILEVGTTCYRPPELLFGGQDYDQAVDLWAAGCVAAQIVCLGRETLFDAGELGSELALIKSMFETLGTPDTNVWPEAVKLPDWGKMNFVKYPSQQWEDILTSCDATTRSVVSDLIMYSSTRRKTAKEMLDHPFLQ